MRKNKNVIPGDIPPERRLLRALNHLDQALRHINLVSINTAAVTDPIELSKKRLLFMLNELNEKDLGGGD